MVWLMVLSLGERGFNKLLSERIGIALAGQKAFRQSGTKRRGGLGKALKQKRFGGLLQTETSNRPLTC